MGKYDELKRLAEAATQGEWERDGSEVGPVWDQNASIAKCSKREDAEFIAAANPAAVLALIAENEALRSSNGFNELALLRMGFRQACEERDRLKAENERLRKDVKDHADARVHYCGKVGEIAGERDQLRAELERARADAERYRWLRERGDACQWMNIIRVDPEDYDSLDAAIAAAMGKGGAQNGTKIAEARASAGLEGGGQGGNGGRADG